jgi:hypothetical protein
MVGVNNKTLLNYVGQCPLCDTAETQDLLGVCFTPVTMLIDVLLYF